MCGSSDYVNLNSIVTTLLTIICTSDSVQCQTDLGSNNIRIEHN